MINKLLYIFPFLITNILLSMDTLSLSELTLSQLTLSQLIRFHKNDLALKMLADVDDINKPIYKDETPLFVACSSFNLEVASVILRNSKVQVNIFSKDAFKSRFIIHYACWDFPSEKCLLQLSVVKALIAHGARLDVLDDYGDTPLHIAVNRSENVELVEFLIQEKAPVCKARSREDITPLDNAARNANLPFVSALLQSTSITPDIVSEALVHCKKQIKLIEAKQKDPFTFMMGGFRRPYTQEELQELKKKKNDLVTIDELLAGQSIKKKALSGILSGKRERG